MNQSFSLRKFPLILLFLFSSHLTFAGFDEGKAAMLSHDYTKAMQEFFTIS